LRLMFGRLGLFFVSLSNKKKRTMQFKLTIDTLKSWYEKYNAEDFNNDLPPVSRIRFKITHTYHMLGQHKPEAYGIHTIKISDYYDVPEKEYLKVLLHEMCHLWCNVMGWPYEHHGWRWENKAYLVGKKHGMDIQRCDSRQDCKVNADMVARDAERKQRKTMATVYICVLDYGNHKWVVKLNQSTLEKADVTTWDCRLNTNKPYKVYKTTNEEAYISRMQASRSLRRGYEYQNAEFEKTWGPRIEKMKEVTHNLWG